MDIGGSPGKSHEVYLGTGASNMKAEAVRAAAVYPQEEKARVCLVTMYKYLME